MFGRVLCNDAKPYVVNGLDKDSIKQLKKFAKDKKCPDCNLVEVMCCDGGCMGGNATINKIKIAEKTLDAYTSKSKDIIT